jgi:hypothetical protein
MLDYDIWFDAALFAFHCGANIQCKHEKDKYFAKVHLSNYMVGQFLTQVAPFNGFDSLYPSARIKPAWLLQEKHLHILLVSMIPIKMHVQLYLVYITNLHSLCRGLIET